MGQEGERKEEEGIWTLCKLPRQGWQKNGQHSLGIFLFGYLSKAAMGRYVGYWKTQGYYGGRNSLSAFHSLTKLLLD